MRRERLRLCSSTAHHLPYAFSVYLAAGITAWRTRELCSEGVHVKACGGGQGPRAISRGTHRRESSAPCPFSGLFLRTSHFSISTAQKMIEPSATAMARSASASASVSRYLWKKGV